MVKIGMVIGDRYEILEKIGTGGMSDVYKAKCHKLNRFVAVKVLKQEFAENENFVSKFIIEAQAAAGLMHPNIVNVYDVGEENGIHYIVMELIEGITLKKYIEKKARLSYKEAVSIAIQVSLGIEAAHNNHIIHRDIKPQNIIISKEGKVKVTDFGIAKAASSNTITSNVMGSVHYTSPEQARGGFSDEKSDVYSLGITMFEMLTGRVPFNGETTVAIAIKHIQEELPSPHEFVPEIPIAVESIVLKCCQKSPDRRYQNMADLVADLKQALISPDEDFVVMEDPDLDGGTRAVSEQELAQVRGNRAVSETSDTERMRLRNDTYPPVYQEGEPGSEEDMEEDAPSKLEKITTIVTVAIGFIVLIIIIFLGVKLVKKF
ncbi:MAG: Stk1 family PASTA domain-containing Ser/Thr kinase, partial [Lachnospiraceae bacterium]|nr:Stk1 family PASTA domain-containing Ser/Thr kinase [Lachnospiraceae bacterium]